MWGNKPFVLRFLPKISAHILALEEKKSTSVYLGQDYIVSCTQTGFAYQCRNTVNSIHLVCLASNTNHKPKQPLQPRNFVAYCVLSTDTACIRYGKDNHCTWQAVDFQETCIFSQGKKNVSISFGPGQEQCDFFSRTTTALIDFWLSGCISWGAQVHAGRLIFRLWTHCNGFLFLFLFCPSPSLLFVA